MDGAHEPAARRTCAGRLADSERKAGAAIRVMGTGLATGHAAGIGAAMLAADGTCSPAAVQAQLRKDGAILDEGERPDPRTPKTDCRNSRT